MLIRLSVQYVQIHPLVQSWTQSVLPEGRHGEHVGLGSSGGRARCPMIRGSEVQIRASPFEVCLAKTLNPKLLLCCDFKYTKGNIFANFHLASLSTFKERTCKMQDIKTLFQVCIYL